MSSVNNIQRFREQRGWTRPDLAKRMGTSPQQIERLEKGARTLRPQWIDKAAEAFGVAPADIISATTETSDGPVILAREVIEVPVIGVAAAGAWREAITVPQYTMPMAKPSKNKRIAFAVEVHGDSMDRLLPEGGWAAVDIEQRTLFEGRVYLIANGDGDATIKRYHNNPARFEPVSNNPEHEVIALGEHPIEVIGRIVSYGNDQGL